MNDQENTDVINLYRSKKKLRTYLFFAALVFLGALAYTMFGLIRSVGEMIFFSTFVFMAGVFNILLAKLLIIKTPLVTITKEDITIGKNTPLRWHDIENITASRKKNFLIVFHVSDPSKYPLTKAQADAANKGQPIFKFNLATLSIEDFEELESISGRKVLEKHSAARNAQKQAQTEQAPQAQVPSMTPPPTPQMTPPPPPPFITE